MKLTQVTFSISGVNGAHDFHGFYVPGTNNLLAIDLRHPADDTSEDDWCITHIPTGFNLGVANAWHTTKEKAIHFAQGFYREFTALGTDLTSADPQVIASKYNAIPLAERDALWKRIREKEAE